LTFSAEHPPLAKIVAAAPLLPMNSGVDCTPFHGDDYTQSLVGINWFYSTDWRSELLRARMAVSLFSVSLCILVWVAARRMFGFGAAVVATLLVAFEPNLLAHGSLVTTDIALTAMLLFAVFGFYLWTCRRSVPLLLLAGLAAGLTLLSKNSGVVLIPMLVVLAIVDALLPRDNQQQPRKDILRNLSAVGAIGVIAFAVIWAGYGMRYAAHPGPALLHEPPSALPSTSTAGRVLLAFEQIHLMPQAYLEGFACDPHALLKAMSAQPDGSRAPWFLYPVTLLIRSTVASLIMAAVAILGIALIFKKHRREIFFLLLPAAMFMAGCMHASWNGGMRHLLPALPFFLILVAAGCTELSKRWNWMKYAVPCLLVLHTASSLHASPNYLNYANEVWRGANHKHFVGDDWGQSYLQVRAYTERHPSENCWLLTPFQWNPEHYDIHCMAVGRDIPRLIPPRMHGTVIVSSTWLGSPRPGEARALAPFKEIPPTDYIADGAMLVFTGDFDTRATAGMSASRLASTALQQGRFDDALQLTDYAIRMSSEDLIAHYQRSQALFMAGQRQDALTELENTRAMSLRQPNPLIKVRDLDLALQSVQNSMGMY
jgi:dolichyl-phosphate-mannose-protein mannosyltransferase